jgi:hypothetical protein
MAILAAHSPISALGEILHAAVLLGPDAWGNSDKSGVPPQDAFSRDLLRLFTLLRDRRIPYLLVGGIALLRYVAGRNTQDVDLVLSVESLGEIPEIQMSDQNRDFAPANFGTVRTDLLFTANPLFGAVLKGYATSHRFHEIDVPCATVEGPILLKLYALPSLYRAGRPAPYNS